MKIEVSIFKLEICWELGVGNEFPKFWSMQLPHVATYQLNWLLSRCRGAAPGGGDAKRQKPAKGVAIAVGPLLSQAILGEGFQQRTSSSAKVTVEFTLPLWIQAGDWEDVFRCDMFMCSGHESSCPPRAGLDPACFFCKKNTAAWRKCWQSKARSAANAWRIPGLADVFCVETFTGLVVSNMFYFHPYIPAEMIQFD